MVLGVPLELPEQAKLTFVAHVLASKPLTLATK